MESFCTRFGISQEFSAPITPQQNSVVERKNKVIQKMARAMLYNKDVARNLWGEAVNTACHTINRVYFRPGTKKTPYELWKGRKPNVKYFKIHQSLGSSHSAILCTKLQCAQEHQTWIVGE